MTRLYHVQTRGPSGWSTRCTFGELAPAADLARALKDQGHKVRVTGLRPRPFLASLRRVAAQLAGGVQ